MKAKKETIDAKQRDSAEIAIGLTKEQYRQLLELVYCGNWLINSWREDADVKAEYDDVENRLLAQAAAAGLREAVEYDRENGAHFFSHSFEQAAHDRFVPDFENEVFWGELAHRLAWRDLEKTFGSEAIGRMGSRERMAALERVEDRYATEFEEHGTDNVHVTMEEKTDDGIAAGTASRKPAEA